GGAVALHPPGENVALPQRDGERKRLKGDERLAKRLPAPDPVPRREEAAEGSLLGGLDLSTEHRERCAPDPPQHVGIAPLPLRTPRAELPPDETFRALELLELRFDAGRFETEASGDLGRRERAARASVAGNDAAERALDRLEERRGHPTRRDDAEGVTEEA